MKVRFWKGFFWKNEAVYEPNIFPEKKRFWFEIFSTCQVLDWEFNVQEDIENKTFRIIKFQRKTEFEKIIFWVQFLRNKISLKNSYVKTIVLTQFAPQKATEVSLFVLILKTRILKQIFSSAIRVWNEVLLKKKESEYEAKFFLEIEILNWDFFNKSEFGLSYFAAEDFRKQNFSNNHLLE